MSCTCGTRTYRRRSRSRASARSPSFEISSRAELRGDVELRRRTDHGDPYLTIQRTAQLAGYDYWSSWPDRTSESKFGRFGCSRAAPQRHEPVLFVPAHCQARLRSEREPVLRLERILVPLALAGTQLTALECACELGTPMAHGSRRCSLGCVARAARALSRPAEARVRH